MKTCINTDYIIDNNFDVNVMDDCSDDRPLYRIMRSIAGLWDIVNTHVADNTRLLIEAERP